MFLFLFVFLQIGSNHHLQSKLLLNSCFNDDSRTINNSFKCLSKLLNILVKSIYKDLDYIYFIIKKIFNKIFAIFTGFLRKVLYFTRRESSRRRLPYYILPSRTRIPPLVYGIPGFSRT